MTNQTTNNPTVIHLTQEQMKHINQVRKPLTVPTGVVECFHGKIMGISFHVATIYNDCCEIVSKLVDIPFVQKLGEMSDQQKADRLLFDLVEATTNKVDEIYSWADTASEYDECYEHFTYAIDGVGELGDNQSKIGVVSSFYQYMLDYEPTDDMGEMLDELDDDTKAVINALFAIMDEVNA